MKRKSLAFLLALTLIISVAGVSLAEFDFSVFEDDEEIEFEVEYDLMDDTGTIKIPIDFDPFPKSTYPLADVEMDIRSISAGLTLIRLAFYISDSTPNVKRVILLPHKTRYTIENVISNTDDSYSAKHEIVATVASSALLPMFEEIIQKQITSVACRLTGDKDIDGTITVNTESLRKIMELYELAGGWKQELFSIIDTMYPVAIKEL